MNVLELTRELVTLDTVDAAENDVHAVVAPLLEKAGFVVNVVEHQPGRGTLIADWRTDLDVAPLCLSGHVDTVPVGTADWQRDPFLPECDGDRLYGRGTADMKGGVAAIVVAAVNIAAGRASRAGLRVVLTAAEESGAHGARAAASRLAGKPSGPLVITEPTCNTVAYGHKGALWLTACANGVTAHGSMPHLGENAVTKLARAVTRLDEYSFESVPHPVMGEPTLNVGTFHGGLNINSVPDSAKAAIDVRTVPGQDHAAVQEGLRACLGPGVALDPLIDLPAVWTDPNNEWVDSVARVVQEVTGVATKSPSAMSYFTDASILSPALGAVPTVICGPGEPQMAHATDEWCSVMRLDESVAILERLCRDWCVV